jgi:hypothetical protein
MPDALRPQQREHQNSADQIRPDQHRLTTEAIDDDAGDGAEEQDGEDLGRDQDGNGNTLPGELVNEDD